MNASSQETPSRTTCSRIPSGTSIVRLGSAGGSESRCNRWSATSNATSTWTRSPSNPRSTLLGGPEREERGERQQVARAVDTDRVLEHVQRALSRLLHDRDLLLARQMEPRRGVARGAGRERRRDQVDRSDELRDLVVDAG